MFKFKKYVFNIFTNQKSQKPLTNTLIRLSLNWLFLGFHCRGKYCPGKSKAFIKLSFGSRSLCKLIFPRNLRLMLSMFTTFLKEKRPAEEAPCEIWKLKVECNFHSALCSSRNKGKTPILRFCFLKMKSLKKGFRYPEACWFELDVQSRRAPILNRVEHQFLSCREQILHGSESWLSMTTLPSLSLIRSRPVG